MFDVIGIPMTIAPQSMSPLFWIIILLFVGFLVYRYIIRYNKERKNREIEKHASLRVIKHVLKTLLQATYMKQNGRNREGKPLAISWIVAYIEEKNKNPDKPIEAYTANMTKTYDMMFAAIISYIISDDSKSQKLALSTIQRCIDMQHIDIDMFAIQTGFATEQNARDIYSMLPSEPLIPGKLYYVYDAADIEWDRKKQWIYIPRIKFYDYFLPSDFAPCENKH